MVTFKILVNQTNHFYFQIEFVSDYNLDLLFIWLQIYLNSDIYLNEYLNTFENFKGRNYFFMENFASCMS